MRGPRRLLNVLGGAAVLLLAGWMYHMHHLYKHLAIHDPGMAYRSGWLKAPALRNVIEDYDIRTVVNLCGPDERSPEEWAAERQVVEEIGAELIVIPMTITTDPADPLIERSVDLLSRPEIYPLLVHCDDGVSRTAKLLAIYDIVFRGMTAEESLSSMPMFGREEHHEDISALADNLEHRYGELYPTASSEETRHILKVVRGDQATSSVGVH